MRPFTSWNLSSLLLAKLVRIEPETTHSKNMMESQSRSKLYRSESAEISSKKNLIFSEFKGAKDGATVDSLDILEHLKRTFQSIQTVQPQYFWKYIFSTMTCFFKCKKDKNAQKYKKFMNKSQSRVSKELDFQKFIMRQRVNTMAILGLLSSR